MVRQVRSIMSSLVIEKVRTNDRKRVFEEVTRVRRRDGTQLTYQDVVDIHGIIGPRLRGSMYTIRAHGADKVYTLKAAMNDDVWDMEEYLRDRVMDPARFTDFDFIDVLVMRPK